MQAQLMKEVISFVTRGWRKADALSFPGGVYAVIHGNIVAVASLSYGAYAVVDGLNRVEGVVLSYDDIAVLKKASSVQVGPSGPVLADGVEVGQPLDGLPDYTIALPGMAELVDPIVEVDRAALRRQLKQRGETVSLVFTNNDVMVFDEHPDAHIVVDRVMFDKGLAAMKTKTVKVGVHSPQYMLVSDSTGVRNWIVSGRLP